MKHLAKVFNALRDETKLKIYKLVLHNPDICVCDIMSKLKMTQTRISRNLGILRKAGLLTASREGFWMHYTALAGEEHIKGISSVVKKWAKKPIKSKTSCE